MYTKAGYLDTSGKWLGRCMNIGLSTELTNIVGRNGCTRSFHVGRHAGGGSVLSAGRSEPSINRPAGQ